MTDFEDETDRNWNRFHTDWTAQATTNWKTLNSSEYYKESYRRLSSLNALRVYIIEKRLNEQSGAFFLEAHNDALVSHVAASFGAWRSALQSLRSCIENSMSSLYFMDHPVELEKWNRGKFKIGFSELENYLAGHPALEEVDKAVTGLEILSKEYSTLSRAVHGSAKSFRMTDKAKEILLWSTDAAALGSWRTREKLVIEGICLLLVSYFRTELEGMKLPAVRDVLYYALSDKKCELLKKELKITITKP